MLGFTVLDRPCRQIGRLSERTLESGSVTADRTIRGDALTDTRAGVRRVDAVRIRE